MTASVLRHWLLLREYQSHQLCTLFPHGRADLTLPKMPRMSDRLTLSIVAWVQWRVEHVEECSIIRFDVVTLWKATASSSNFITLDFSILRPHVRLFSAVWIEVGLEHF